MNSTRIHVAQVLFAAVAVFGYGCMSRPPEAGRMDQRVSSPAQPLVGVRYVGLTNEPVREAASAELGAEAAREIPLVQRPAPKAADPGAKALVDSMVAKLPGAEVGAVVTRIGVKGLKNQGRCRGGEFSEFCERLTGLLNRSAGNDRVEFVCDPSPTEARVDYELGGTAYLATVEGFDVWELYLNLKPAANEEGVRRDWVVWESEGPVRVLRQARAGQPEILPAARGQEAMDNGR